jgi:hypothetical protein
MAERLAEGVAENGKLLPLPGIPLPSDISAIVTETSDGPNGLLVPDRSSSVRNKASHPEITNNESKVVNHQMQNHTMRLNG